MNRGQGPHHVEDVGQLAGKLGRVGGDRLVGFLQQRGQQGLAVALLVQDPGDGVRPVRQDDLGDPVADKSLIRNAHRPEFTGARAARMNKAGGPQSGFSRILIAWCTGSGPASPRPEGSSLPPY